MPAEGSLADRSLRPYTTTEKYLLAVREDLAEWLNGIYPDCAIDAETFFTKLETGVLLCKHVNTLIERLQATPPSYLLPASTRYQIPCRTNVQPGTFQARDNICSCLRWLRAMATKECLLFETDDLVLRKNEKSVILCLMEVARIGARLGLAVPTLIQFEKEIDADELRHSSSAAGSYSSDDIDEVASSLSAESSSSSGGSSLTISAESLSTRLPSSLKNVDQVVTEQVKECRCQTTFPLVKVAPGKYRVGPSHLIIYVRILRNHVMVRVGGGWDTLEHFLEKHDPCRRRGCCNPSEPLRSAPSATSSAVGIVKSQPPPPPHKQKTNLTPLQVVFNRKDCPSTAVVPSRPSIPPLSAKDPVVPKRRSLQIPQPGTKVELRRSNPTSTNPVRAPRARSMDVGLLLDQMSTSVKPSHVAKPVVTSSRNAGKAFSARPEFPPSVNTRRGMTSDSILPMTSAAKVTPRKRYSLMKLEEIPSGRREKAVTAIDTTDDNWDTAYNRHRQNFLRLKNIFAGAADLDGDQRNPFKPDGDDGENVLIDAPVQCDDMRGRHMGSPSSPADSATEDGDQSEKCEDPRKPEKSDLLNRLSVEDGFYSDASWKSE